MGTWANTWQSWQFKVVVGADGGTVALSLFMSLLYDFADPNPPPAPYPYGCVTYVIAATKRRLSSDAYRASTGNAVSI